MPKQRQHSLLTTVFIERLYRLYPTELNTTQLNSLSLSHRTEPDLIELNWTELDPTDRLSLCSTSAPHDPSVTDDGTSGHMMGSCDGPPRHRDGSPSSHQRRNEPPTWAEKGTSRPRRTILPLQFITGMLNIHSYVTL